MKKTFFCFLILFISNYLFAKNTKDSTDYHVDSLLAIEYFNIADTSYKNVEKCFKYTQLASPLLYKTKQWDKYVYTLLAFSYCFENLGRYSDMEKNNHLAVKEASQLLGFDHPYYKYAIINLGYLYSVIREDYAKSNRLYKSALRSLNNMNSSNSFIAKAAIYENLSFTARQEGDYITALSSLENAYQYFSKGFVKTNQDTTFHTSLAGVKKNIAQVYLDLKNYPKAINTIKEAIRKVDNKPKINKNTIINFNIFLSKIYFSQGDQLSAKTILNKVINRYSTFTNLQKAKLFELEGNLLNKSNKDNEAVLKVKAAIKVLPNEKKIEHSKLQLLLGDFLKRQKHFDKSLKAYEKALSHLLKDSVDVKAINLIEAKSIFRSTAIFTEVILAQAETLKQWYTSSGDLNHLKTSHEKYLLVSQLTDQLRQNYKSQESKLFLTSANAEYYEEAIRVSKMLFDLTKNKKYLHDAFYFMEKSKSVLLLDELRLKQSTGVFIIPESYQKRENQFKIDLNFYNKILLKETRKQSPDIEKIKNLKNQIFKLKEDQLFLKDSLNNLYPNYFSISDNLPITVDEVRKKLLTNNKTLIEYFIGKNTIYTLKISSEDIQLKVEQNDKKLSMLVNQLLDHRRMDNNKSVENFTTAAYELFKKLILPLNLSDKSELIIVPDGILGYLPFEVLLTKKTNRESPKSYDFLIKKHQISYSFSATILNLQNAKNIPSIKPLGVFPIFENSIRYLSNSERELKTLETFNSLILKKEQSNVNSFLKALPDYNLIHLSTHAIAEDSILGQPAFYLRDSIFYLSDLYNLNINAHLVIMSACETGVGKQRNGEGIMSLARGFTYAGVPSILTTLWNVNDKSSADILTSFYKNLNQGFSKDKALHLAKLDYLQNCSDIESTPYHWAGIIQIGNTLPIKLEQKNNLLYWISIPFILGIFFYFYRKSTHH